MNSTKGATNKKVVNKPTVSISRWKNRSVRKKNPDCVAKRILVPLDFSGKSRQALEVAVPLAECCCAKIFLIHVVEPAYAYPYSPGEIGFMPLSPKSLIKASRERLSGMARELIPTKLMGRTLVRTGRAYVEIIDAARDLNVDLIVISTHGFSGLKHILLGSTAEHVVRHACCPVLTVRRH